MSLADDLKNWTDTDAAVLALGRSLGVFDATTTAADVKAILWTNSAAGNTLYGMLERLAWLGVLEFDDEQRRYRAATPQLHPLSDVADVPTLEAPAGQRGQIRMAVDGGDGFSLEADRAGFRHLARVFDEIASSGLGSGWSFQCDDRFGAATAAPDHAAAFTFRLIDPNADEPTDDPSAQS